MLENESGGQVPEPTVGDIMKSIAEKKAHLGELVGYPFKTSRLELHLALDADSQMPNEAMESLRFMDSVLEDVIERTEKRNSAGTQGNP